MEYKVFKNKKELIESGINSTDIVLDVGFWGQGVDIHNPFWAHSLLKNRAKDVYGPDLTFNDKDVAPASHYLHASAEDFNFSQKFDVIFAGDLIEHLSNPGLFLERAKLHLKPGGRLVMTTPNCFNLFHIAEKITKYEPTVNSDHTCYFNTKTLAQLLKKQSITEIKFAYVYSLNTGHKESFKKKFLNGIYWIMSLITTKYLETLVVIAEV